MQRFRLGRQSAEMAAWRHESAADRADRFVGCKGVCNNVYKLWAYPYNREDLSGVEGGLHRQRGDFLLAKCVNAPECRQL